MDSPAICVQDVSKQYRLGSTAPYKTLRDSLGRLFKWGNRERPDQLLWALRGVSFEIRRGEIFGIVGRNGAGKSTLLKILSRITRPTEGRAITYGRVGSLLEVGAGFHPELTGRENVYLNAAILGMSKEETRRKLDSIVEFAEVAPFIEMPVKHYSSGMYVRLAFSVAVHLRPAILLVDEVLGVGDARFWSKSIEKMRSLNAEGMTIAVVTHNLWIVQTICSRALCLEGGRLAAIGTPLEVIQRYREYASAEPAEPAEPAAAGPAAVDGVRIDTFLIEPCGTWANERDALPSSGARVVAQVTSADRRELRTLVRATSPDGLPYFTSYGPPVTAEAGRTLSYRVDIERFMLMPGDYLLWFGVCSERGEAELLAAASAPLLVRGEGHAPREVSLFWNEGRWSVETP